MQWSLLGILWLTTVIACAVGSQPWMRWSQREQILLAAWFVGWFAAMVLSRGNGRRRLVLTLCFPAVTTLLGGLAIHFFVRGGWRFVVATIVAEPWSAGMFYLLLIYMLLAALLGAATLGCSMLLRLVRRRVRHKSWRLGLGLLVLLVIAGAAYWGVSGSSWRARTVVSFMNEQDYEDGRLLFGDVIVKLSPDGRKILVWSSNDSYVASFEIWDAETGRLITEYPAEIDIFQLKFSPDSRHVAYVDLGTDQTVVRELTSGRKTDSPHFPGQNPIFSTSFFSENNNRTLSLSDQVDTGKLTIDRWDSVLGTVRTTCDIAPMANYHPTADWQRLVCVFAKDPNSGQPPSIALQNLESGATLVRGPTVKDFGYYADLLPPKGNLAVYGDQLWNIETNQLLILPGVALGWAGDGRLVLEETTEYDLHHQLPHWLWNRPLLYRVLNRKPQYRMLLYDVYKEKVIEAIDIDGHIIDVAANGRRVVTGDRPKRPWHYSIWDIPPHGNR